MLLFIALTTFKNLLNSAVASKVPKLLIYQDRNKLKIDAKQKKLHTKRAPKLI